MTRSKFGPPPPSGARLRQGVKELKALPEGSRMSRPKFGPPPPPSDARLKHNIRALKALPEAPRASRPKFGPPPPTSDLRLKRDVGQSSTLPDGIRLHEFSYLGDERRFVGVMAQELLADARYAGAVSVGADGFYRVDYEALGLGRLVSDEMVEAGTRAADLAGS
jgi:hypothetical protein